MEVFRPGVALAQPAFYGQRRRYGVDNLTGLIWLMNANCDGAKTWADALTYSNNLASGNCGLTDGSVAGDWRLPNVKELQSLIHYGVYGPVLPNTAGTGKWSEGDPFTNVQSALYWSSNTYVGETSYAWYMYMCQGAVGFITKPDYGFDVYVWPVRGGN